MNERIRELWNQSRYPSGRGHDEGKFAELIVRECISKLEKIKRSGVPALYSGRVEPWSGFIKRTFRS